MFLAQRTYLLNAGAVLKHGLLMNSAGLVFCHCRGGRVVQDCRESR